MLFIGSSHFVFEDEGVEMTQEIKDLISSLESKGSSSLIYLAISKKLAGIISIYDPLKPEAKEVVQRNFVILVLIKSLCLLETVLTVQKRLRNN